MKRIANKNRIAVADFEVKARPGFATTPRCLASLLSYKASELKVRGAREVSDMFGESK